MAFFYWVFLRNRHRWLIPHQLQPEQSVLHHRGLAAVIYTTISLADAVKIG